jgi:hypothetical protein
MVHDESCELGDVVATIYSSGCKCASRAYAADPLPDDWTPIWTPVWAMPGQDVSAVIWGFG